MAHTTTPYTFAALAAGAVTLTATALTAPAADARINTTRHNRAEWTVPQSGDWETMSNLPMHDAYALPPYGWRNGFRVRVGARWDSGLFYGAPWGNLEARATVWQDGPAGPATVQTAPALVYVRTVPLFADQHGGGHWLTGCQAAGGGWNVHEPVAYLSSPWCTAPTVAGPGSNYRMGGYMSCVRAAGYALGGIPSSWFDVTVCPRTAQRV